MRNSERQDLKKRTKEFGLRVIRVYLAVKKSDVGRVLGRQLLRSGTSVGAHYREAFRAKSTPDFISKLEGALQELDESDYWMELLADAKTIPISRIQPLRDECNELIAIFVASVKSAKKRAAS